MKENTNKFHQTENSFPLLDDTRLYLDLGQYRYGPSVPEVLDGTYQFPKGTTPAVFTSLCRLQRPPSVSITTPTTLKYILELCDYCKWSKKIIPPMALTSECISLRLIIHNYDEYFISNNKFQLWSDTH